MIITRRGECIPCAVCGKEFIIAPYHAYKHATTKEFVCSYSCMLKTEAEKKDRRSKRIRYTVYCPDGYVAKSTGDAGRHMGIKPFAVLQMIHQGKIAYEAHTNDKGGANNGD